MNDGSEPDLSQLTEQPTIEQSAVQPEQPEQQPQVSDFVIPDAYKDKPFAAKIKTSDDLWKQVDNLEALAGKKGLVAPDFSTATEEEALGFFENFKPESVEAYNFFGEEDTPDERLAFSQIFHDTNIPVPIAKAIYEKTRQLVNGQLEASISQEGLEAEITVRVPDGNPAEVIEKAQNEIKKMASKETMAALDKLPNSILAAVYEVVFKQAKAYGASEGAAATGQPTSSTGNVEEMIKDVEGKIENLDKNPLHTAADRSKLIKELTLLHAQRNRV